MSECLPLLQRQRHRGIWSGNVLHLWLGNSWEVRDIRTEARRRRDSSLWEQQNWIHQVQWRLVSLQTGFNICEYYKFEKSDYSLSYSIFLPIYQFACTQK